MINKVMCHIIRQFDKRIPYLVMLHIGSEHFSRSWRGYPANWAVMDDFGNLVMVEEWL